MNIHFKGIKPIKIKFVCYEYVREKRNFLRSCIHKKIKNKMLYICNYKIFANFLDFDELCQQFELKGLQKKIMPLCIFNIFK